MSMSDWLKQSPYARRIVLGSILAHIFIELL